MYKPLVFSLLSVMAWPALSADWSTNKSINASLIHSDNSGLTTNAASGSETLLQVRPSFGINAEGARLQMNFNYSLGLVFSDGGNNRDDVEDSHFLNARASIEAIEDNLFIDVNANAGITSVSSNAVVAQDIATRSNNTTQTYALEISPYYRYHFGSFADALIRYSADSLSSQSNANDGSNSIWSASLSSGRRFTALNWVLSARQSELSYDNGPSDETSAVNADFSIRINRFFTADFGIGHEENDYQNNLRQYGDTDGMTWDVGTTWTPNPRTSLKLSYGDRFTGENWNMDLRYRHRKSTLTASYLTSVTNSRNEQINSISGLTRDINGDIIFIGDTDLLLDPTLPSAGFENIVQSQFKLAYQYATRRTTVGIDTSYSERDYQTQILSTEDMTVSLSVDRKITPRTSLKGRISWVSRDDTATAASDQELISYNVGLNTKLGTSSSLSLDYLRSENDTSGGTGLGGNAYDENRFQATLGMNF